MPSWISIGPAFCRLRWKGLTANFGRSVANLLKRSQRSARRSGGSRPSIMFWPLLSAPWTVPCRAPLIPPIEPVAPPTPPTVPPPALPALPRDSAMMSRVNGVE